MLGILYFDLQKSRKNRKESTFVLLLHDAFLDWSSGHFADTARVYKFCLLTYLLTYVFG